MADPASRVTEELIVAPEYPAMQRPTALLQL